MRKLGNVYERLTTPTRICPKCLRDFKTDNWISIWDKTNRYCPECLLELKPKFHSFILGKTRGIYIYEYDKAIRDNLFLLKGCYDIELYDYFLARFASFLRLRYHDYIFVPMPSNKSEDETRGFNHVEMLFSPVKLPYLKLFYKNREYKQSDQSQEGRKQIFSVLEATDLSLISRKKVLLIDDVCTTGSTLSAAIKLLSKGNPKKIKILVMAKTIPKKSKV